MKLVIPKREALRNLLVPTTLAQQIQNMKLNSKGLAPILAPYDSLWRGRLARVPTSQASLLFQLRSTSQPRAADGQPTRVEAVNERYRGFATLCTVEKIGGPTGSDA